MLGIVLVSYKTEDKTIAYVQQELSKIQCNYILVIVNNSCTKESNIKLAEGCRAELVIDTDKVDSVQIYSLSVPVKILVTLRVTILAQLS